ncbi:MAG: hypothetical protein Q9210_006644, partial [Variospora velana]
PTTPFLAFPPGTPGIGTAGLATPLSAACGSSSMAIGAEAKEYVSEKRRGRRGMEAKIPHLVGLEGWEEEEEVVEEGLEERAAAAAAAAVVEEEEWGRSKMWRVALSEVTARRVFEGEMARERMAAGSTPRRSSEMRAQFVVEKRRITAGRMRRRLKRKAFLPQKPVSSPTTKQLLSWLKATAKETGPGDSSIADLVFMADGQMLSGREESVTMKLAKGLTCDHRCWKARDGPSFGNKRQDVLNTPFNVVDQAFQNTSATSHSSQKEKPRQIECPPHSTLCVPLAVVVGPQVNANLNGIQVKMRKKKNVKKGIQFCLMVCGASGTGRTTFVNTLCGRRVLQGKDSDDPSSAHLEQGVRIKPITVELELDEEGTRVSLTIVDTPGFGDLIDNEASFSEITGYLERQYDDILAEESRIKRNPRFRDNRVHALLYFITPTGHGLRELDIELMRRLSPMANVIPVIGKADSLTPAELAESKKLVMEDIEHYRIPVYNFPYDIEEDDEDTVEENSELRGLMPFAIVGSEEVVEIGGRRVRARQYPWGIVEIDNPRHSDFLAIRSALLHSHLADLKEITHDFLYENYRTEKLSKSVDGGAHQYVLQFFPLSSRASSLADGMGYSDSSMNPEDLASQSVRLKEEQLRREEEKLREIEMKVQREINEKRQELLARESQLKEMERMHREQSVAMDDSTNGELS